MALCEKFPLMFLLSSLSPDPTGTSCSMLCAPVLTVFLSPLCSKLLETRELLVHINPWNWLSGNRVEAEIVSKVMHCTFEIRSLI